MRRAVGQVAREAHRVAHYLLFAVLVLLLGCAALGWRLAQGPIPVAALAGAIEAAVNTQDSPTRLSIGRASIAWEGLQGSGISPLQLRLEDVRLLGQDGAQRAELPDAEATLSIPWLLHGQVAPRRMVLHGLVLRLRRDEQGQLSARLARPGAEPEGEAAAAAAASVEELVAELMKPPHDSTPLGALAQLTISDARVLVEDAQLGAWSLDDARIDLRRLPAGGITGGAAGTLRLGEGSLRVTGTIAVSYTHLTLPTILLV